MSEELSWSARLGAVLRERMQIIADEESRANPPEHMQRLHRNSTQLEQLRLNPAAESDPRLAHYLAQGSYTKALEYLEKASTL